MATLYVNNIKPTTGSYVTVDENLSVGGNLYVTGTLHAKATDFVVNANSTVLGDHANDTITINASTVAIPNNLAFDTSTLFLNASTNRVAVVGTSPEHSLSITGTLGVSGDTTISGTTHARAVNVGVDGTGYDVKFFGDTSGKYLLWDQSEDTLQLADNTNLTLGTGNDADIYYDGTDLIINPAVVGSGDVVLTGGSLEVNDNEGVTFGTGKDATIQYDGTDLVVNPKAVGSGLLSVAGTLKVTNDITASSDILLNHDAAVLKFGANEDVTLAHVHDQGLTITNTINGTDDRPVVLTLKSEEDAIVAADVIGRIDITAGDSDGTDAAAVAASIEAVAEGTFGSNANATTINFKTGDTAPASTKLALTSGGNLMLLTDASELALGEHGDTKFTHVADTGLTLNSTRQLQFNDGNSYIYSPEANDLEIVATDIVLDAATLIDLQSDAVNIGEGGDTDVVLTFNANSSDGVITWMEDEDYFQYSDDILFSAGEALYYTNTTNNGGSKIYMVNDILTISGSGTGTSQGVHVSGSQMTVATAYGLAIQGTGLPSGDGAQGVLYFGKGGNSEYIHSSADNVLNITAGATLALTASAMVLETNALAIGGDDDTDIALTFKGATSDGVLTWMEDEDHFKFSDDVVMNTTSKLYFHDEGGEYLHASGDGTLEIDAGTELDVTVPTVDINASTEVQVTTPSFKIDSATAEKPVLQILSTNADENAGRLQFVKDGANAADDDRLGTIDFFGENDAGSPESIQYGTIYGQSTDVSDGSEDGTITFKTMNAGNVGTMATINPESSIAHTFCGGLAHRAPVMAGVNGATLTIEQSGCLVAMGPSTAIKLPTPSIGLWYRFVNVVGTGAGASTITSTTDGSTAEELFFGVLRDTNSFTSGGNADVLTFSTNSTEGDYIEVYCISATTTGNANTWFYKAVSAVDGAITAT